MTSEAEGASLPSGSQLLPASLNICLTLFFDRNIEKLDHGNFIQAREIKEHCYKLLVPKTPDFVGTLSTSSPSSTSTSSSSSW